MNGTELIAQERQRQIDVEGWTPEHDATHRDGEMAISAACYALVELARRHPKFINVADVIDVLWPFGSCEFKPTPDNRIRELEKAGALIAAEIDRLLELEARAALEERKGESE